MNYYFKVLRSYAVFGGRARRSEYWYFFLCNIIASLVLSIIGVMMKTTILYSLYSLAVALPAVAVGVRRMHDVGKSGWFSFIPVYGLILACAEGTYGDNQYGTDPKDSYALSA